MRKFLSFAFVLVMVFALAVPALAVDKHNHISVVGIEHTSALAADGNGKNRVVGGDVVITFTLSNGDTVVKTESFSNIKAISTVRNVSYDICCYTVAGTVTVNTNQDSSGNMNNNLEFNGLEVNISSTLREGIIFIAEAVPATCREEGYTQTTCTIDGCEYEVKIDIEPIDPDNHVGGTYEDVITAATCVAVGEMGTYCEDCDALLETEEIAIDPDNHVVETYTEVITPAKCEVEGEMGIYCGDCDVLLDSGVIEALEHILGEQTITREATCTVDGTWVILCTLCNEELENGIIPADHDWTEVRKEVTCLEDGCIYIVCNRDECNEWYYKEHSIVEKSGHNFVFSHTKPMTCTEDGVDFSTCTNCGDWGYMSEIIPASCTWDDGVVENGKRIFTCLKCGKTRSEDIPEPTLIGVTAPKFIGISETSKNSRVWTLSFEAKETYSDGSTKIALYSIDLIGNNANLSGKIDLGNGYTVIYDIKGNGSNIKEFKIIKN